MSGTVTVSPGVDLSPNNNSFTFNDTIITGGIVVDGAPFAGTINVPAITGGSVNETTIAGSGTVNSFTATGETNVPGVLHKTFSATLSGSFQRVGGTVIVTLTGSATITCIVPPAGTFSGNVTVVVHALFVPTAGNGLSGTDPAVPEGSPVTAATFAGTFVAAGT